MNEAKFILSKSKLLDQVKKLTNLGLKVSYSYKTNRIVGDLLQELSPEVDLSIHAFEEIEEIKDKSKIHFFTQAELEDELKKILELGIRSFVVDNEVDFKRLIKVIEETKIKIDLSLRMKFQEHRVGTGKYFVYGMPAKKVNELILEVSDNEFIGKLGIHLHRKSQNTSEWEIVEELEDSISEEVLGRLDFVNLGGGLPSVYRSSSVDVYDYVFGKLKKAKEWLEERNIETIIEPGRFLAAPCIVLETEVIQKYDNNLVINTTIYNGSSDNIVTGTKMLIEGELNDGGNEFLIKGNSPTRDDIFRYKVRLREDIGVGDKIVFLNAGAYNYTTDFFGYKKLETEVVE
ncbi:decarboxylase [Candidatus Pacearchaeota archaeon]|nr:decarboxylase [Candidatus Pacearchaeota archaeon]|tara:strand:+ start:7079 stop:8116 length:1038 start_codon:yes stop_codon:yes gene_type:complete